MGIKKYVKKRVVVEAFKYEGWNLPELADFTQDSDGVSMVSADYDTGEIYIVTLEGNMKVSVGDYVIKGVKGEFYTCKPDIFQETYEEVNGLCPSQWYSSPVSEKT